MVKSVLFFFIAYFSFSCSQNMDTRKKVNNKNDEERESVNQKENKPMLFPIIIAGSIGLIQKVYIKKEE